MTFAETLELVMAKQGLRAADVAERSGISPSYISKLFNGRVKEPTWSKTIAIIDALGITPNEFRRIQDSR